MDQGRGIFSFLEQSCKQLTSEHQVKIVKIVRGCVMRKTREIYFIFIL